MSGLPMRGRMFLSGTPCEPERAGIRARISCIWACRLPRRPASATPDVIHETNSIECLENHAPHGKEARAFVECFEQLGTDPRLFFIRCFLTADLFQKMENLEDNVHFTIKDYRHLLEEETALARQMIQTIEQYKKKLGNPEGREELDDLSYTQQHYGNLFKHFSEYHYYEEPYELLTTRLERNDIHIENTASKTALDCGCGGGRYTVERSLRRGIF